MKRYLVAVLLLAASALAGPAMSAVSTPEKTALPEAEIMPPVLRFVVYYPHFPPYIYTEPPQNQVIGIIPDLLAPLFEQLQIRTEYVLDNRSGAEQRLYKGEVDAMMTSPSEPMGDGTPDTRMGSSFASPGGCTTQYSSCPLHLCPR